MAINKANSFKKKFLTNSKSLSRSMAHEDFLNRIQVLENETAKELQTER